jgi:hypothetical protein
MMGNMVKEAPSEIVAENECRHYWMIDSADGHNSQGVCKFCGAQAEFCNWFPGSTVVRRNGRVFEFPADPPDAELDKEQDDFELEASGASL